ncbi:hypothetical protein [Bradyrhizobium sp. LMTR 3]|uniref:hypothetical protein n=1 Tax=Bradyrhizobium sp. LMTR 3 TaxID=189873 RepID=UPI000810809E|nr:hypothetical protein [Bradyrhizobium sp. LMTR 3]OCK54241.1 hypothetical protein LMTR3_25390 [Bradyrhizobium sp. LMTR 3]
MTYQKMTTSLARSMVFSLAASSLLLIQASTVRADPALCLEKAKSYFAEIDQLLSKEKNWIMPFVELNERYSPLEDCDTDLLLQEATRWRFIQPIIYNPHAKYYLVRFWSDDVKVQFAYYAIKKKSDTHSAGWVSKCDRLDVISPDYAWCILGNWLNYWLR